MSELTNYMDLEEAEKSMLDMPQAECPVSHIFGPGLYIRELRMPAGVVALGHKQRFAHMNNLIQGKVLIVDDIDGSQTILEAPMVFLGKPGRKIGYVIEDVVWQNIYATNETDIDILEETYLEKTEHSQAKLLGRKPEDDYTKMLEDVGISSGQARAEAEITEDMVDMPAKWSHKTCVRKSAISGKGFFATHPVGEGEAIAPARIGDSRTPAGRYTNHSSEPNAKMIQLHEDIVLVALKKIKGCVAGSPGEEITVDYRDAIRFRGKSTVGGNLCQV